MSTNTLPRLARSRPQRRAGPVLTPTQRPGLPAAIERSALRVLRSTVARAAWAQRLRDFRLPGQAPWLSMRGASSSARGRNLRPMLLERSAF